MYFFMDDNDAKKKLFDQLPQYTERMARQLVKFCWLSLPQDRRNPSDLEQELHALIERAIPQMEEELKKFDDLLE